MTPTDPIVEAAREYVLSYSHVHDIAATNVLRFARHIVQHAPIVEAAKVQASAIDAWDAAARAAAFKSDTQLWDAQEMARASYYASLNATERAARASRPSAAAEETPR